METLQKFCDRVLGKVDNKPRPRYGKQEVKQFLHDSLVEALSIPNDRQVVTKDKQGRMLHLPVEWEDDAILETLRVAGAKLSEVRVVSKDDEFPVRFQLRGEEFVIATI